MKLRALSLLLALLPFFPSSRGPADEAHYVDASLDFDGEVASWHFLDLDDDSTLELVVAVVLPGGERELRVHPLAGSGLSREASTTIRVLPDVVGWGAADVRSEPGRELVFLTRSGAWSYSTTLPGYRDNIERLASEELVYDMPDARSLLFWDYVFDDGGSDRILLPGRERISIWGPAPEGASSETPYAPVVTLPTRPLESSTERLGADGRSRGAGVSVSTSEASPFLRAGSSAGSTVLANAYAYAAPALRDLDGDGRRDLVVLGDGQLALYLAGAGGLPAEPTRVEALPEVLAEADEDDLELRLADVDGDRFLDLVVRVSEAADGFENRLHRLLVYRGDATSLLREKPDQVLRFEAGDLDFRVVDVDSDGRPDLLVEKLVLPSLVGVVTGVEFTFERLLFPGEKGSFARRPAFRDEQTFDEETAFELAASRSWRHDCDGDGTADLVEVDLRGDITVRRLRRESSGLRGSSWRLDATPWKRYAGQGTIGSLRVEDYNGDGLGDIVSAGNNRLTVLLSVRAGGGR